MYKCEDTDYLKITSRVLVNFFFLFSVTSKKNKHGITRQSSNINILKLKQEIYFEYNIKNDP